MELSFGQRIDPENGLCECWFTHGALDEIKSMDLSDKIVVMYGAGRGDLWLAKRCKKLYVIERDIDWYNTCQLNNDGSITYVFRPCTDCNGHDEFYTAMPEGVEPDVVIVDDAYRYECIVKALTLKRPLILIVDNWMQDFVFICPAAEEILQPFEKHIHLQADHRDHNGMPWKTLIGFIK